MSSGMSLATTCALSGSASAASPGRTGPSENSAAPSGNSPAWFSMASATAGRLGGRSGSGSFRFLLRVANLPAFTFAFAFGCPFLFLFFSASFLHLCSTSVHPAFLLESTSSATSLKSRWSSWGISDKMNSSKESPIFFSFAGSDKEAFTLSSHSKLSWPT